MIYAFCLYRVAGRPLADTIRMILVRICAEGFRGADRLRGILKDAQKIVKDALAAMVQRSGF
jgi:hypothetical protein